MKKREKRQNQVKILIVVVLLIIVSAVAYNLGSKDSSKSSSVKMGELGSAGIFTGSNLNDLITCNGDMNGDGEVNVTDLMFIGNSWGCKNCVNKCGDGSCDNNPADEIGAPCRENLNDCPEDCMGGYCDEDVDCDDGLYCNGGETCDLSANQCLVGTAIDCDDGISCTNDSCNEGTDSCGNIDNCVGDLVCDLQANQCEAACSIDSDCDDGLYCNGVETCVAGSCQAGTSVSCNDGIPCTSDICNEGTNDCSNDNICSNNQVCQTLGICGEGVVAWIEDSENNIYAYDISTGNQVQVTSDGLEKESLEVYDNYIVWSSDKIYMYNMASGETLQLPDSVGGINPKIYGDKVIYQGTYNFRTSLMLYDISSGNAYQIRDLDSYTNIDGFDTYENKIAMYFYTNYYSGGQMELVLEIYDLGDDGVPNSGDEASEEYFRIYYHEFGVRDFSFNGNKVIWDTSNSQGKILVYDIDNSQKRELSLSLESHNPVISNERIVYQKTTSNPNNINDAIFMYDSGTQQTTQITELKRFVQEPDRILPSISNDRIVWYENTNGGDIFLCDLSIVPEPLDITSWCSTSAIDGGGMIKITDNNNLQKNPVVWTP